MIQTKMPKKIKGARKKRRAEEKAKAEQKAVEDTGIYRYDDTLYIREEKLDSYLEEKLMKSGIKYYIIPKPPVIKQHSENYVG